MSARVLLVGWESAERELVRRWMDEGRLPTLARLRAEGQWRDVESPAGLGDDAAWTSFSTGVGVDVHLRAYWKRIATNGHDLQYWRRNDTSIAPFWDELARGGARVAVIDVPSLTGSDPDALVVTDWMGHAVERKEPYVRGPGLTRPIARDSGWECDGIARDPEATRGFERVLTDRAALRSEVLVDLLTEDDWDLFVAVTSETHCVGHQRWHDHDPVEKTYRLTDADLARLVEAAGPDAVVIAFSLLGMGPNHSGEHLLDEILLRLDGVDDRPSLRLRAVRAARGLVPAAVRRRAPQRVHDVHRNAVTHDRARRSAWLLPTDLSTSAIRIGVVGRDDGGTVEPDAVSNTSTRLVAELRALRDPESGRHLVDDVIDVRSVHGPAVADAFADLLVVWSQDGPIDAARSSSIGVVRGSPPHARTGNHTPYGWVVAAGPGIDGTTSGDPLASSDFATFVRTLVGATTP